MSNEGKVGNYLETFWLYNRMGTNYSQVNSVARLNAVIFKDKAAAPVGKKFVSLFPGLGYAAGYKVRSIVA